MALDLVILGTGGHGRETLDVVEALRRSGHDDWRVLGFLDDAPERQGALVRHLPVLGGHEWLLDARRADVRYVLGIGSGRVKARLAAALESEGRESATLVHPTAVVAHGCDLAPGVVLAAGVILGCDVRLGAHSYVNIGASVSHDGVVGRCCHLAPGARLAGNVTLSNEVEFGVGAVAMPGVRVGRGTIVGAGAAVVRDLPADCIAAGVPARVLRSRREA